MRRLTALLGLVTIGAALACGDDDYDPCADKQCGDLCTLCDPDESGCLETKIVKRCDRAGQCVSDDVSCN